MADGGAQRIPTELAGLASPIHVKVRRCRLTLSNLS